MAIIGYQGPTTGTIDVIPNLIYINTTDSVATVTTAGYLTSWVQENDINLFSYYFALVNTTNGAVLLQVSITGPAGNQVFSLVPPVNAGGAIFAGNVQAGSNGVAGHFISFPAGANLGNLSFTAANQGGNFASSVTNAAFGQATTLTIPDPGAAAANFLLDTGAGNLVTDYQQMLPVDEFLVAAGGGVFVLTRTAQGDWGQLHTTAADTTIIGFEITEQLRQAAGKGFKLNSFDVIYSITTLALVAHTVTLATTVYANNVATAVTNAALTGALATATQANPYVTNITVNVPAFNNPAAGTAVKQVIEVTVNAGLTSVYSFKGINLRFTKSIS